jgi:cell division cycle protein 37
MAQAGTQAEKVFLKDVEDTYALLRVRAEKARTEEEPREQIQLVQEEGSNKTIEFNVPDGPPPEHLILEGPGTEDMDVEEVRKSLQARWDIFTGFPQEFQDALNGGTLEAVNKVLGDMSIPQAEDIVQLLQISGMLQFAEEGIREVERPLES